MFSDVIVHLLQEKHLTAYMLSKETGISEALISQWKNGRQFPKYSSINALCDYFGCSADYLLERTGDPTPPPKKKQRSENTDVQSVAFGGEISSENADDDGQTT